MQCFERLGLTADATEAEVRRAYLALASTEHPDHGGSAERFTVLKAAYDQALKLVREARPCSACRGRGRIEVEVGWMVDTRLCPACRGKRA